jgi:electron transfer flavoprotein alpha subunit
MATGEIWVFSENKELLAELIAGARELAAGNPVVALAVDTRPQGADRVLALGPLPEGYILEDIIPTLIKAVDEGQPRLVLIGATRRGRVVAGRLAAHLNVTALTDVLEFQPSDGALTARHMIFGGGAERVDRPLREPIVATVGPGVFQAQAGGGAEGEVVEIPFVEPAARARLRERKPRQVAKVNLAAARKVVCAGRGLSKQEDLAMVEELACALGAEVACTRPLAEGFDWLPRERYIGISGAMIKPDLYLGIGVSGQAQHLIGMSESRVVVAVNKDPNAPLVAQADYVVAEDLYKFVPALIQALGE